MKSVLFLAVAAATALIAAPVPPPPAADSVVGAWQLEQVKVNGAPHTIQRGSKQDSTLTVTNNRGVFEFRFTFGGVPAVAFDIPAKFEGIVPMTDPSGVRIGNMEVRRTKEKGMRFSSKNLTPGVVPDLIEVSSDGTLLLCATKLLNPNGPSQQIVQMFRKH
jgi:hypothetical protein